MKQKLSRLTQSISQRTWINLVIVFMLIFYAFQTTLIAKNDLLCQNIGGDFCAYWSAGQIIQKHGIADVYNLDILQKTQREIQIRFKPNSDNYVIEVPYLPFFILYWHLFSFIDLPISYLLWTAVNLLGFVFYLIFFIRQTNNSAKPWQLILLASVSLPLFKNLLYGQLNVFLAICAGEFMRALLSKKDIKAGLWLGGWLLKPQLLILILPFLLIRKYFKTLLGFFSAALVIFGASFTMIGVDGFMAFKDILLGSAGGAGASSPLTMMNWRALGLHLGSIISPTGGWVVAIIGTFLTTAAALFLLRKKRELNSTELGTALLGVFAATCAATWHAHIHMALILIPPMLYLLAKNQLKIKLFVLWVGLPILVEFSFYFLGLLVELGLLPDNAYNAIPFIYGFRFFVLNLLLLSWAIKKQTINN